MKDCWISNKREYQVVYRKGIKKTGKRFIVYSVPSNKDEIRVGITVTKKIGNAVVRNRTKRRLREIIRQHIQDVNGGVDIVVVARKFIIDSPFSEIEKELEKILKTL